MATPMVGSVQFHGPKLTDRELREALEYDKILSLRDDVFSGRHPRLKVPVALNGKPGPRPVHSPTLSSPRSEAAKDQSATTPAAPVENRNAIVPVPVPVQPLPLQQKPLQPNGIPRHAPIPQAAPASRPSVSGIDPVLLTKSDDLVRAEIQLKRQRIERVLREQLDNRRAESRHKDASSGAQDLDLSDILAKAFELVTPLSETTLKCPETGAADSSDSFDENSFYSSRVNTPMGTSEGSRASFAHDQQGQPMELDSLDADVYPVDSHKTAKATRPEFSPYRVPDAANSLNHRIDDARNLPHAPLPSNAQSMRKLPEQQIDTQEMRDSPDEEEYSPPEPIPAADLRDSPRTTIHHGPSQGYQPQNERREPAHIPLPPSPNTGMHIVSNNVRSPVAPQPARISPLAMNKPPPFVQNQRQLVPAQNGHAIASSSQHAAQQSPETGHGPLLSQKRRRAAVAGEEREGRVVSRRAVESPEPRIKEEPISPPPFTHRTDLRQVVDYRGRQRESPGHDEYSMRDPSHGRYYIRESDHALPSPHYEIQSPSSPVPVRVSSRTSLRRPVRDEQDLRRVASIQYARQPPSPPLYPVQYPSNTSRSARATSHALVERIADEPPRYYRESVRPVAAHNIRDRSRSPQPVRERYASVVQVPPPPPPMARPPRRIIVDQHGREYYVAPNPMEMRHSVAPPSRHSNAPIYYDEPSSRDRIIRVPLADAEAYEDGGYVHRMGPPVGLPRHYAEPIESEAPSYRVYRQRDYSVRPAEQSSLREVAPREADYIEPRATGRADDVTGRRVIRTHSVVPGGNARYEVAPEYASRLQSVRPEPEYAAGLSHRREAPAPRIIREASVRVDDGRRYAEYVPDEERFHYMSHTQQPPTQARRYVEEPVLAGYGREMVPDTAGAGSGHVYRY